MYTVKEIKLRGCLEIIPNLFCDKRGESIKLFHKSSFEHIGIKEEFREDLIVISNEKVFRGMHFQNPPYAQAKLVSCLQGRLLDIILDIREGSPTYGKYEMIELNSAKKNLVYIPVGFAHGYFTLQDKSIMSYKMSNEYNKQYEQGINWNSIGLKLDMSEMIISDRDKAFGSINEFKTQFIYSEHIKGAL